MCLYLGTSKHVSLSWHIDTCVFIWHIESVSLSWHIETCVFILAHRNMCLYHSTSTHVSLFGTSNVCLYLGTSTRVFLSWHIETCALIMAHRHMCLYFRMSFKIPSPYKSVSCFCNHSRTEIYTSSVRNRRPPQDSSLFSERVPVCLPPSSKCWSDRCHHHYRSANSAPSSFWHPALSWRQQHTLPSTGGETHFFRTEAHHDILVWRSLQAHFRPIIRLSNEERLTDLRHFLPPNWT